MIELEITLKKLLLDNFCGSGKETVDFKEGVTNIAADNGMGKTRLNNAFNWLFFDKNAEDRKDFNIKNTIDLSRNRQSSIVEGVIVVNGSEIVLRKIYSEKWQKKQGSKETEFTGNETEYYFNGVPLKKVEYKAEIDAIIKEELFKLLSNVKAFTNLQWKLQREILFKLVPEVTDEEIAATNKDFQALLSSLTNGKTIEKYKLEVSSKKGALKETLRDIPGRIDEVGKSKPLSEDWAALEAEIAEWVSKIEIVEGKINAELAGQNTIAQQQLGQQTKVNDLKTNLQNLEFTVKQAHAQSGNELTTKKTNCRNNITNAETAISTHNSNITKLENKLVEKNALLSKLRIEFDQVLASEFTLNEASASCSQCNRPIEGDDREAIIEDLKTKFVKNRQDKLDKLNLDGPVLAKETKDVESEITSEKDKLSTALTYLEALKGEFLRLNTEVITPIEEVLAANPEIIAAKQTLATEEAKLVKTEPIDQTALTEEKRDYQGKIDALKARLNNKNLIANADNRIKELTDQESTLSQELADLERIEFTITAFDKARIDKVEGQINAKFQYVNFKLFETQVNGAEVPMCEAQIGGVPISDANTASKIVAGLDIIKTLSNHYNVRVPIFLDEKESITVLPEVESQLITLEVRAGVTELLVS